MRWLVALLVIANVLIFTLGRDGGPGPERVELPARPEIGNLRLLAEVGADEAATVSTSAAETGKRPVSTPAGAPFPPTDTGGAPSVDDGQEPAVETAVEGSAIE